MTTNREGPISEMYSRMEQTCYLIIREQLWERGHDNYGDAFLDLGPKGQFSDIWRKMKKLKKAIWDEEPLVGEQAEQIAAEIIPHLLMLIFMLNHPELVRPQIPDLVQQVATINYDGRELAVMIVDEMSKRLHRA